MKFYLPHDEKVTKGLNLCRSLLMKNPTSLHLLSQLQGFLESCHPAVWVAPLHFRHLQCCLIYQVASNNRGYQGTVLLDPQAREELKRWINNMKLVNVSAICPAMTKMMITSDASKMGLGCHIRQAVNKRAFVTSGNPPPHQCLGTESYLFGHTDFPETPLECIGETLPRQHNGGCLYKQPRGYLLTQSCLIDTRSMEMVSSAQHFDICRIPPGHLECSGGQTISNLYGFEQLVTTTTTSTTLSQTQGDRSLCIKANAPATTLCELAPRPLCSGHRCIFNRLGPTQSLCVPTIQSHSKDFNESELTTSSTSVASSTLVATLTTTHSQAPSTSPLHSSQTLLEDPSNPRAVHPMCP